MLIAIGTALLMLPISTSEHAITSGSGTVGDRTSFLDALFTATSASCLTGLITVDTGTHWSGFGEFVIIILIQLGGLGFMTIASIFGLMVAGRLGINRRAGARVEGRGVDLGEVSWVVRATIIFTAVVELFLAVFLSFRFYFAYDYPLPRAIWEGIFHAISAFNNAGFALYTDNVIGFNTDALVILPLAFGLLVGGIGFPVLLETFRRFRRTAQGQPAHRWSLTARFTWIGTAMLVLAGFVLVAAAEWNGALKGLSGPAKVLNAFFAGVSPRTAGFNALDYLDFHPSTLLGTDILMFIGGGSGGTAGGVKITTVAVIVAAVLAEIRGEKTVSIQQRQISPRIVRQSLAVFAFGGVLSIGSLVAIMFMAPQFTTDQIAFDVVSAFATVGLSTGITPMLPAGAQGVLIMLMFAGRVGPIVLATALAARTKNRLYEFPEERPFIG
ncbi:TrkH family potassium uptake protein [Corynebacterium sp. H78]|uniref:TrkH family potassium uptake protein n=1 Tax=Corynebacterium sp. H78 TaxID=3133417 RepID=UPI00309EB35F